MNSFIGLFAALMSRLFTLLVVVLLLAPIESAESAKSFLSHALMVPENGKTGFTRLSSVLTGVAFTNILSDATAERSRILENGSGVALGDVDGDGLCDIYLCRLEGGNVLYRNLGNWKFEEMMPDSEIACNGQFSTGAVFSDIDGDGDLDLLITSIGRGARCFRNDGHGRFSEDLNSGLEDGKGSTSMALADVDGDGDLDLYVANYRTNTIRDGAIPGVQIRNINGTLVAHPPERFDIVTAPNGRPVVYEKGEPDRLYLNDGAGHFAPQSWTNGRFLDSQGQPISSPPRHWGLSVAMRDFTGDGAPDIYVCNDFIDSPDDIWINDGTGRFSAIESFALRNTSWASMAVDFSDINRDGLIDFFVVDMLSRSHQLRQTQRANADMANVAIEIGEIDNRPQNMRNTLFLNQGDGTFSEIAQLSGLQASDWSWSPVFMDVDLDGYEDLLITNGNGHDIQDADSAIRIMERNRGIPPAQRPNPLLMYPSLETQNVAFRNGGDLVFEETGDAWGFDDLGISQGMAVADLDNDGDLDVVVNNLNRSAGLYRNETSAPRLAVRLQGEDGNFQGIGSQITVSGGPITQSQEVICGNRYLSGDDPIRVFAAGGSATPLSITVNWRSGAVTELSGVQANRLYEIYESPTTLTQAASRREVGNPVNDTAATRIIQNPKLKIQNRESPGVFFEDVSERLNHSHHELPYSDFSVQPLLPHRFSQLGPGIAWFDVNEDGFEDLIIGSGRGARFSVLQNDLDGGFTPLPWTQESASATGDQTSLLGMLGIGGKPSVLAGISNYEGRSTREPAFIEYSIASGSVKEITPYAGQTSSVGPMALADIDGDGDLDLFAGGRLNPGEYPAPASSRLFRYENGRFRLDRELSRPLVDLALVSGAVFSDLDADGDPDLVLACDWGPLRIFRNDRSHFIEVTSAWGFSGLKGRWNGVTTGDFNNDGKLDIVASNWGRNTKFQRFLDEPLYLYYSDYDSNGTLDLIEAYADPESGVVVPWRGFVSMIRAMPFLRQSIPSFDSYGRQTVESLFAGRVDKALELIVHTLDAMIFINHGTRFEGRALPNEAQFAPSFGVNVGDFDGDGNEDIFLSQNFFAVHMETSRYDAGRGLWLRGDGRGGFESVGGKESGILVYGEQRGSALCDFDHDGRLDLAVTQNAAATKLYRNIHGKPGLRIRLKGSAQNSNGIGASLRLIYENEMGPVREIHAGSGYWSQDGSTQVMGTAKEPRAVWIRWPDGKTSETLIPQGALEIVVEHPMN